MHNRRLKEWQQRGNEPLVWLLFLLVTLLVPLSSAGQEPDHDADPNPLGPGDWVYLFVPDHSDLGGALRVDETGQLQLEAVRGVRLRVTGRTVEEVSAEISRLFEELLGIDGVWIEALAYDAPGLPDVTGRQDEGFPHRPSGMADVLHPGDTVLVSRDRAGSQVQWEVVDNSGFLLLPGFGYVRVRGQTLSEVIQSLEQRRRNEPTLPELRLALGPIQPGTGVEPGISAPRLRPGDDEDQIGLPGPGSWWWSVGAEGGASDRWGMHVFYGGGFQMGRGRSGALVQFHGGTGETYSSTLAIGGLSARLGSVGPVGIAVTGLSGWYQEDRGQGIVRDTVLYGGGLRLGVQIRAFEVGLAPKVLVGSYIEDGWENANPVRMMRIPVSIAIGGGPKWGGTR